MTREMIYGQDSKAHDWDFTLPAKREIISGNKPLQTAASLKAADPVGFGKTFVAKAIRWQFVKLLGRIVR